MLPRDNNTPRLQAPKGDMLKTVAQQLALQDPTNSPEANAATRDKMPKSRNSKSRREAWKKPALLIAAIIASITFIYIAYLNNISALYPLVHATLRVVDDDNDILVARAVFNKLDNCRINYSTIDNIRITYNSSTSSVTLYLRNTNNKTGDGLACSLLNITSIIESDCKIKDEILSTSIVKEISTILSDLVLICENKRLHATITIIGLKIINDYIFAKYVLFTMLLVSLYLKAVEISYFKKCTKMRYISYMISYFMMLSIVLFILLQFEILHADLFSLVITLLMFYVAIYIILMLLTGVILRIALAYIEYKRNIFIALLLTIIIVVLFIKLFAYYWLKVIYKVNIYAYVVRYLVSLANAGAVYAPLLMRLIFNVSGALVSVGILQLLVRRASASAGDILPIVIIFALVLSGLFLAVPGGFDTRYSLWLVPLGACCLAYVLGELLKGLYKLIKEIELSRRFDYTFI